MRKINFGAMALLMAFIALSYSTAQGFTNLSDCLVTNDIGIFAYDSEYSRIGNACGVLGGADHFKVDHVDSICTGSYSKNVDVSGLSKKERFKVMLNVEVQVTQHTGGDSDRWLLHEVEDSYRDPDDEDGRLGLFSGAGVKIREINGNKIIYWGLGGGSYTWISGQKVIENKYTDLQRTKPEPIEVVKAYLAKFPSTITLTDADLKGSAHNVQWIKDEIDRRLWLCDKWNAQSQAGGVAQADLVYNLVRSMTVFLNYRQKYYSISADADQEALLNYKQANDLTSINNKLTEYKTWWAKHKEKRISL